MKNRFGISALFVLPVLLSLALALNSGCSSSTTASTNESTVTMQSQLTTSDASRAMPIKAAIPTVLGFDTIVITNAVVFVSDVKLHWDKDDMDSDTHAGTIKTGPFVIVFDSSGTHVVTTATVPAGTYDRVKFEFHKPDKNADQAILEQYPMLQNGGQTYSAWVYGYTVLNGIRTPFSVASIRSENLTLHFQDKNLLDLDSLAFSSGSNVTLAFELDPRILFHLSGLVSGTLFDPRDTTHQKDIDSNILLAIRVVKF